MSEEYPSTGDYASERSGRSPPTTRAINAAFQVNSTHRETASRLSDVVARLRNLTVRVIGVLPPSKLDNELKNGAQVEPDNLISRFRTVDRDMNRSLEHMQEYLSALEDQL